MKSHTSDLNWGIKENSVYFSSAEKHKPEIKA
jgi:hypothetical protein